MKYLESQQQFEQFIGRSQEPSDEPIPDLIAIWFSAPWCAPCRRINTELLESRFPAVWLKCDIDRNDYTAGYCGIRSIPSFLVIYKKKIVGIKTSSNTNEVIEWLESLLLK
jgi:thiol-disulfide isomerase/thioredoxin